MSKKGILLILDGYGEGAPSEFNAVSNANTPFLHSLKNGPHSLLKTDGEAVGLFEGVMGGSEVGHTTIGAGRVITSTAKAIHDDIKSGKFFKNKNFVKTLSMLEKNNGNLNLVGLMSDKNVHSNINHALEIVRAASSKVNRIFLHLITDGRDCGTTDSLKYLKQIKRAIKQVKNCEIASISGRAYAMDRENNLERTNLAFNAMFGCADGEDIENVDNHLKMRHFQGETDEFIKPARVKTKHNAKITKNDCVFFFNFREDRLRQLAKKVNDELPAFITTMANVSTAKSLVLYPTKAVKGTLSEHLSNLNKSQVKISESTKYAHVTYFLNGGEETPFAGEDRIHIPTAKVVKLDVLPEMQAKKITKSTIKSIKKNYDAIIINYSNADMIGHTGNYLAALKSLECLDKCVKKVADYALKHDYFVLITADHGNIEQMRTETGEEHTAHTLNKVICAVITNQNIKMKQNGELKDVAPTFLSLMQVEQNSQFKGKSLLV